MMAYNLVCLKAFATGSRFSVEGTLDGRPETKLSGFLFAEDDEIAWGFGLPSGMVQLLVAVGVTRNELAFSRSNGAPRLLEKLAEAGLGVRTVIDREELKLYRTRPWAFSLGCCWGAAPRAECAAVRL